MDDIQYMQEALALAAKARGYTSPNPMVGAVVVRNSNIVGRGWHHAPGLPHAEVEAINDAGKNAEGADIYVTLEPCNHYGKTPPCTRKIVEAGIRRVVVATEDPNPFVKGGGIDFLRSMGIPVDVGVCREEAETLIEDFIWYVQNDKKPFVILKCAATLDGRLATSTGDSRWVTSSASRKYVHELRHACEAILVGSGTLKNDNPSLTARLEGVETRDPKRVILDSSLSISPDARVLNQPSNAETIIVTSIDASMQKAKELQAMGATLIRVPCRNNAGETYNRLDLPYLMNELGKIGVMSLLVEGGGRVAGSFLSETLVNKVMFFIAPKILGGDDGIPVCRGKGPLLMKDAFQLKRVDIARFDDDTLVSGYLK
nr:bifunctional diaminohydroxyphosphoribosylaminopyrimidine deaminase/5-amino-6-(5-phosphoribosylamino)uracil reductase RibD [Desulfamplus magnetovallimortis]